MDFFLDNLLDTFRVLTFQRTPLYKDWRHVIPGERLETFDVEYAEKPAGRVAQWTQQTSQSVRKLLSFLFMRRFKDQKSKVTSPTGEAHGYE